MSSLTRRMQRAQKRRAKSVKSRPFGRNLGIVNPRCKCCAARKVRVSA